MNILLLRGFNNYFNRTVKKYSTLGEYRSNSSSYLDLANINFNPNDGIATELIIGSVNQKENNAPLNWENIGTPDYLVCYENNEIKSRWFVLESERTRAGQYRIALKRDVLAEHFDKVMKAPCFVEKGYINDITDPLLYNNESLTYNQIKKEEYALKDSTGTGWIVGYLAKNRANTPVQVSTQIALIDGVPTEYYEEDDLPFSVNPNAGTTFYDYTPNSMTLLLPMSYFGNGGWGRFYIFQGWKAVNYGKNGSSLFHQTNAWISGDTIGNYDPLTSINDWGYDKFSSEVPSTDYNITFGSTERFTLSPQISSTNVNISGKKFFYSWDTPLDHDQAKQEPISTLSNLAPSVATANAVKALVNGYMQNDGYTNVVYGNVASQYNGKYVKIGNSYYRMSISPTNVNRYDLFTSNSANNAFPTVTALNNNIAVRHTKNNLGTPLVDVLTSIDNSNFAASAYLLKPALFAVAESVGYNVVLSRISTESLDVTLQTGRRITYDCPANIFAIPYGTFKFKTADDSDTFTTQKEEGLALARAIASTLGADVCYDLQLVPYVPSQLIRDLMENSDTLNLTDLEPANYDIATRTSLGATSTASFVLYPSSCKGTFDIMQAINKYNNQSYSAALNTKISNETQLCRLVSPNFNGMFEFSLAKNNGVSKFNIDYTYKPIMPYIHVNPDFKFIYGQDWDDARGLILGGDFSLTFINDAWVAYENNNKNYQAIFNRQIESMDINNAIANEKLQYNGVMGVIGNTLTGVLQAAKFDPKAVAALTIGQFDKTYGWVKDADWLRRQQEEAKDYATDMYSYQLGNIKAMPYSLSRSESLTNNNKIYPIIELYEPTEKEIENLVNKLNYNGMTIMATGKLEDYAYSADFNLSYVKGQLIRLTDIDDDFHVADTIYQEVNKGFYVSRPEE